MQQDAVFRRIVVDVYPDSHSLFHHLKANLESLDSLIFACKQAVYLDT